MFFPGRPFGHLTSNVAESTNACLEDVRKLKPTAMFAEFVLKVNVLFHTRRTQYAKMDPDFLPKTVADTFDRSIEAGRRLGVVRNSESIFEVKRLGIGNSYRVVNNTTVSCIYGFPQEEGIPCAHLCAASLYIKQNPIQLLFRERVVSSLRQVYSETTTSININLLPNDGTLSPVHRRGRGRPPTRRIRSVFERHLRNATVSKRSGKQADAGDAQAES